jgi:hypothetical protein
MKIEIKLIVNEDSIQPSKESFIKASIDLNFSCKATDNFVNATERIIQRIKTKDSKLNKIIVYLLELINIILEN